MFGWKRRKGPLAKPSRGVEEVKPDGGSPPRVPDDSSPVSDGHLPTPSGIGRLASSEGSLLAAQLHIFGGESPVCIIDAGAQHGQTTEQYLRAFPGCKVIALEPESSNHTIAAATLAPFGDRVELIRTGLSHVEGVADLKLTSHSGAHSLLEVGDMRYYDEPVAILPSERIETTTVDILCQSHNIDQLDILKMDIQGGELMALQGAEQMLSRGAIRAVVLEVLFQPLYRNQPTFWDLAQYLRRYRYVLQGLYEPQLHSKNPALLRWADAIFVAPQMAQIPGTN